MPGERTEQATQHRREKARKEGDMLHSRELSAAAGTLAGVMVLGMLGGRVLAAWRAAFAGFLDLGAPARWEPAEIEPTLCALRRLTLAVLAPAGRGDGGGGRWPRSAVGVLQTGGVNFHAEAIGFKPDRINPVSNLKNLFSLRAAARLAKSLLPGRSAGRLCRAAHRPAVDIAALFDRAPGDAGLRCLRTSAGRRLAALRLVGDRLPGRVAEPRVAPEDEPPGHARRDEGDRGQSRRFAAAFATCSARCAAAG